MGCRQVVAQSALVRFASVDGRVVSDPARSLSGRGAWLHPSPDCWSVAVQRNAFARAFRTQIKGIDSKELSWQRSA